MKTVTIAIEHPYTTSTKGCKAKGCETTRIFSFLKRETMPMKSGYFCEKHTLSFLGLESADLIARDSDGTIQRDVYSITVPSY